MIGRATEKLPDTITKLIAITGVRRSNAFDRTDLTESEAAKLQATLETLEAHPDVRITVTGRCDTRGSRAVNDRYSRQRAEAVKAWLVRRGIAAARIAAKGAGSDYEEPDAAKARRANIEEQ